MTQLIVALDTHQSELAKTWVKQLGNRVGYYKVGMELFTTAGPDMVKWLKQQDKKVFLDLKFHDIPNTASKAVAAASSLGVDLCTIHASGGPDMLRACRELCEDTKLLAVTVLTSIDQNQLDSLGISRKIQDQVKAMANMALETGIHGIICAPTDLVQVADYPLDFLRVTPGIRPVGSPAGDQKRVMTPAEAAKGGASHIVVGRPITATPDPVKAAEEILNELEGAR